MEYTILEDNTAQKTAYGVALTEGGRRTEIPCLSCDRAAIEALTALLNDLQVAPCHFEDVVEDYLTDFSV